MDLLDISDVLVKELWPVSFSAPVAYVYSPLVYARRGYARYVELYGIPPREIVLVGMNPGPWGMAQTGVPFGDVLAVRDWLGIDVTVDAPARTHPKRPVEGFRCRKREVSGTRLWGWARERFDTPAGFFERFFVVNYCPFLFIEDSGRNRTPDRLPKAEQERLFEACGRALRRTVECLNPRYVIGVGRFAEDRARDVLPNANVTIGRITHPSPANPRANRDWKELIEGELRDLGIKGLRD